MSTSFILSGDISTKNSEYKSTNLDLCEAADKYFFENNCLLKDDLQEFL
jgi:hypothetical protein